MQASPVSPYRCVFFLLCIFLCCLPPKICGMSFPPAAVDPSEVHETHKTTHTHTSHNTRTHVGFLLFVYSGSIKSWYCSCAQLRLLNSTVSSQSIQLVALIQLDVQLFVFNSTDSCQKTSWWHTHTHTRTHTHTHKQSAPNVTVIPGQKTISLTLEMRDAKEILSGSIYASIEA